MKLVKKLKHSPYGIKVESFGLSCFKPKYLMVDSGRNKILGFYLGKVVGSYRLCLEDIIELD